jgi:hypothetical protein
MALNRYFDLFYNINCQYNIASTLFSLFDPMRDVHYRFNNHNVLHNEIYYLNILINVNATYSSYIITKIRKFGKWLLISLFSLLLSFIKLKKGYTIYISNIS